MIFFDNVNKTNNQACKEAMDLGRNNANTLRLPMFHNGTFEKIYGFLLKWNFLWLHAIATISMHL
jgi:hypothetical protein